MGILGKTQKFQKQQQQRHGGSIGDESSSSSFCNRCTVAIARQFSLKCAVVLILSLSVFLPSVFWFIPLRPDRAGFDANDEIKLRSAIQAHILLQKPVSKLVKHIVRLEYEIYTEIGVPSTKVAILSMHQSGAPNYSHVVFGVLSDPTGAQINSVSLTLLRSSLVELFLKQSNLTLTNSLFGEPSEFGILKFPGGITLIPEQYASVWQIPQILFNITLNTSAFEMTKTFPEFKEMLKFGLLLRSEESVYVQITSSKGSTIERPVTAQVSVMSNHGSLSLQRLRQLGHIIIGSSPEKNLGLDGSVFGKIKEISLSSFLNDTLHVDPTSISPAPAPAPEPDDIPSHRTPSYPPQPQEAPAPVYFPDNPRFHVVTFGSYPRENRRKYEELSPPLASSSISSSLSSNIYAFAVGWPS